MKNIAIFGCGKAGQDAFLRLQSKCRIACFLDNDRARHGSRMLGVTVHDPVHFDYSKVDHVFIASMYFDEILGQLLELRVPSDKIEHVADEVLMRNPSRAPAAGLGFSHCVRAFRRMFYVPFRFLR